MVVTLLSSPGNEARLRDLHGEHLRETGFLIGRRRWCFESDDASWTDAAAIELGAARHLLALQVGGVVAMQAAFAGLDSDDEDLVLGSLATIAAGGDIKRDVPELLVRFLASDEPRQQLWRRGLEWASSDALGAAFTTALVAAVPAAVPERQLALAEMAIARTSRGADLLLELLKTQANELSTETRDAIALALGRVGHGAARVTLTRFWHRSASAKLCEALLVLGHFRSLPWLRKELAKTSKLVSRDLELLGLSGEASDAALLHRAYEQGDQPTRVSTIGAMGWLGAAESIPVLIAAMRESDAAETVDVTATMVAASAIDADADVIEDAPVAGPPAYSALQRITAIELTSEQARDSAALGRWWTTHKSRFEPKTRYRFGEPYRAVQSLQELENPRARLDVRRLLATELRLRSTQMITFDPAFSLSRQRQALAVWREAVAP